MARPLKTSGIYGRVPVENFIKRNLHEAWNVGCDQRLAAKKHTRYTGFGLAGNPFSFFK